MEPFNNRRITRMPHDPLDKFTIVSVFPKPIVEKKFTVHPGIFEIPEGSYEKPGVLVIGPSSWYYEKSEHEPVLEIRQPAFVMAKSVVDDYCNGLPAYLNGVRGPGLFYVPGSNDSQAIVKNHADLIEAAKAKQIDWYKALVHIADTLWSQSQSPRSISNDARLAAKELQVDKNKPWMLDFSTMAMINCPACGVLRNNAYPVCKECGTIVDKDKYTKMGLAKAV